MVRSITYLIALLGFLRVTAAADAGPMLSLSSTAPDLTNLTPGQTVTIRLDLAGLAAGDNLDFLAAAVSYDSTLLGPPTIAPGGALPDPAGFLSSAAPGLADGTYDVFFGAYPPIVADGVFYSFDVQALMAGSGSFSFTFTDSSGTSQAGGALDPVTPGGNLPFRIASPQQAPVPEPASVLLWALGGVSCLASRLFRRGRAAPGGERQ
jgi:hypothetical protein